MNNAVKRLRSKTFNHDWPLKEDLTAVASKYPSHNFIANPASQNVFVYLTQFVKACSESLLRKPLSQIDILDWGCGKGQISKLIGDLNPHRIESCDVQDRGDCSFGQDTPIIDEFDISVTPLDHPFLLPYQDGEFDVVLSFGVLEHVADDRQSLKEIYRILRSGGLFFCFFLPTKLSWTQFVARMRGDNYHDRLYSRKSTENLLRIPGFRLEDFWYRQILPKNTINYPAYRTFERLDLALTEHTPLRYFATNIEFVAVKDAAKDPL